MQQLKLLFTVALVPIDFIMLIMAGMVPYFLRALPVIKKSSLVSPVFYALPVQKYLTLVMGGAVIWMIFFVFHGLYSLSYPRKFLDQIVKIVIASTTGMAIVIIALFLKREFLFTSRFIVLTAWALSIILIIIGRGMLRLLRRQMFKKGIGLQNAVLIGGDENTQKLCAFLKKERAWGYNVLAVLTHTKNLANKIARLQTKDAIDEIILADLDTPREHRLAILGFCNAHHIAFRYAADMFTAHVQNVDIDSLAGMPLIEIRRTPLYGWGGVLKRIFDLAAAFLGGLVILPFLLIVAILVKLDCPKGPILVKLPRIGVGGKTFSMYKFRSMIPNAHEKKKELLAYNERREGPLFKMTNDPRITRFGRFIRRLSLDEFPQLINVIKGEMSLVGPRAHEPEEVAKYQKPHKKLLYIRPGIVCLAAISGRSGLEFKEEAMLDTYYVENWSAGLDLAILLKTPFVVLSRKNAV